MLSKKYVIGNGLLLEWAMASWAEVAPDQKLHAIDVGQDSDYRFDLCALAELSPHDATAFVAWGPQFLNFRRLELMGELKARGFRMPPLICRGAIVAASATLGENCAVGAAAVVGTGCKVGFNSYIGAVALVGSGAHLGSSVWVADGAQIGTGARVGTNSMLGRGVILSDGVITGRQCILDIPGRQMTPLADKVFFKASFPAGIEIIDVGSASIS